MTIFKPDDFRDDWYGYLTNQFSHLWTGVGIAWLTSVAVYLVANEMPLRTSLFALILMGYLIYEFRRQGWQGWDTIEDAMFVVAYGAGGAVAAFEEVTPGEPLLQVHILKPLPFAAAAALHLSIGCAVRVWRKRAND